MMNMGNLMKQFGQMQKKLTQAQEELKAQELTGYAPNKSVTVVVDGQKNFKSIKLTKEAINPIDPQSVDDETIEMLEDLITQAINEANKKASSVFENKMKGLTGGIHIPGLF